MNGALSFMGHWAYKEGIRIQRTKKSRRALQDRNLIHHKKLASGTYLFGNPLKAEFNSRSHKRFYCIHGQIARSKQCWLTIFHSDDMSAFLDRQYTVFGEVTDGMETADAIVKLEKDGNDCPLQDAKMTKVTVT